MYTNVMFVSYVGKGRKVIKGYGKVFKGFYLTCVCECKVDK